MKFSKVNGLFRKVLTGGDKSVTSEDPDAYSDGSKKEPRSIATPSLGSIRSFRMKPKPRKDDASSVSGMEIESVSSFSDSTTNNIGSESSEINSDSALGSSFGRGEHDSVGVASRSVGCLQSPFGKTAGGRPLSHIDPRRGGSLYTGSSAGSLTLPNGRGARGASFSSPLGADTKVRPLSMASLPSSSHKLKLDIKISPASPLLGHTRSRRDQGGNILSCLKKGSDASTNNTSSTRSPTSLKVSFNKRVTKWTAMAAQVYDRKSDPRPSLSPSEKMSLYIDLMSFKLTEMLVHESSLQYTNKHLARLDPDSLEIMSKIINEIITRHLQSVNARQQAEQKNRHIQQHHQQGDVNSLKSRAGSERGLQNRPASQHGRTGLRNRPGSQSGAMGVRRAGSLGVDMGLQNRPGSQNGVQSRSGNQNVNVGVQIRQGSQPSNSPVGRNGGGNLQYRPLSVGGATSLQNMPGSHHGVAPRPERQRQAKMRPQSQMVTPTHLPSQSPNVMHNRKKIGEILNTTPVSNNVVEVTTSS
ncbi:hypothetical protein SARC_09789 [Sphaeroforma arctica JP610]|uniref:Uncharacterized protein n=1 Tax=Sphaeroforma arctica JP610 TaxID=667725 RepID=A0A0L0FMM8_9EUKA|nr:hypothetical protein SARC_09789 [Sphaeroforma arctica JP610]KNC77761.1 hypothetical protein SARC_09789 [Sphaeroforma arctica JP610]|eukprot:XP_014151663.1 hypothetical protein SARC_09789 [Sphaeroforma arctica JP610]